MSRWEWEERRERDGLVAGLCNSSLLARACSLFVAHLGQKLPVVDGFARGWARYEGVQVVELMVLVVVLWSGEAEGGRRSSSAVEAGAVEGGVVEFRAVELGEGLS